MINIRPQRVCKLFYPVPIVISVFFGHDTSDLSTKSLFVLFRIYFFCWTAFGLECFFLGPFGEKKSKQSPLTELFCSFSDIRPGKSVKQEKRAQSCLDNLRSDQKLKLFVMLFVKKIIDLFGGQINDPSNRAEIFLFRSSISCVQDPRGAFWADTVPFRGFNLPRIYMDCYLEFTKTGTPWGVSQDSGGPRTLVKDDKTLIVCVRKNPPFFTLFLNCKKVNRTQLS